VLNIVLCLVKASLVICQALDVSASARAISFSRKLLAYSIFYKSLLISYAFLV
jgi:hypothetical protein